MMATLEENVLISEYECLEAAGVDSKNVQKEMEKFLEQIKINNNNFASSSSKIVDETEFEVVIFFNKKKDDEKESKDNDFIINNNIE